MPPMLGSQLIQMGCLIAARDSVGRNYPLCAAPFYPAEWSAGPLGRVVSAGRQYAAARGAKRRYARAARPALLSIPQPQQPQTDGEQSDILVIGDGEPSTLNWKLPGDSFDPQFYTSFWWTNQTTVSALHRAQRQLHHSCSHCCLTRPAGQNPDETDFILRCLNPEANRYDDEY